jgi:hypothetical protein
MLLAINSQSTKHTIYTTKDKKSAWNTYWHIADGEKMGSARQSYGSIDASTKGIQQVDTSTQEI